MESLRDILADNLTELMALREDLDTQAKISARAKKISKSNVVLAQSSIGRIKNKQVHTSLDIVELLAQVFCMDPLDLLRKKTKKEMRETPSYDELQVLDLWRQLKAEDKHKVLAYLSIAVATNSPEATPLVREVRNTIVHQAPSSRSARSSELAKTLLTSKEVKDAAQDKGTGEHRAVAAKRSRSR